MLVFFNVTKCISDLVCVVVQRLVLSLIVCLRSYNMLLEPRNGGTYRVGPCHSFGARGSAEVLDLGGANDEARR